MVPPKNLKACLAVLNTRTTRSKNKSIDLVKDTKTNGKRKANENEVEPPKRLRPALGNITNAVIASEADVRKNGFIVKPDPNGPNETSLLRNISNMSDLCGNKKRAYQKIAISNPNEQSKPNDDKCKVAPLRAPKVMTRAATRARSVQETAIPKPIANFNKSAPVQRIPNECNQTEDSLPPHQDLPSSRQHQDLPSSRPPISVTKKRKLVSLLSNTGSPISPSSFTTIIDKDDPIIPCVPPPSDVIDFDRQTPNDPYEVSEYTMDIFNYLKEREKFYPMQLYMDKQPHISKWMRMLVVDWMVEVQETFELNHETLYLAVKILDSYLARKVILKDNLQLLGAASLFIACKFDERIPPMVDDFLFICDGAYGQAELIAMELDVFKTIHCNLGFPLSYRFVRRYAKCAFISLPILTLARFILEYSLMDYTTITLSDSKMASAALYIALRMVGKPGWSSTLEYYSGKCLQKLNNSNNNIKFVLFDKGYKLTDFADIVLILNAGLHRKQTDTVKHVRNKYSHKLFHEVAKVTLLSNEELLEGTESISLCRETVNYGQSL